MNLVGGVSKLEPLTAEEIAKFEPVVAKYIEEQTGTIPDNIQFLGKLTQIVNGTNYFLKVNIWHTSLCFRLNGMATYGTFVFMKPCLSMEGK